MKCRFRSVTTVRLWHLPKRNQPGESIDGDEFCTGVPQCIHSDIITGEIGGIGPFEPFFAERGMFADAKARRGMARLRLRGLRGAEEEFLIGAAVLNLLLLARPPDQRPRKDRTDVVPLPPSVTLRSRHAPFAPAPHAAVSLNS